LARPDRAQAADTALYRVKGQGKNGVILAVSTIVCTWLPTLKVGTAK